MAQLAAALLGALVLASGAIAVASALRGVTAAPRSFRPGAGHAASLRPERILAQASPIEASAGSPAAHHYEYVFPHTGEIYVYDIDNGHQLVQHVKGLPDTDGIRGVIVSPSSHVLYISHGGDGSGNGNGSMLAYDLISGRVLWNRRYGFPIDSGAISADGMKIFMPSGELDSSGVWNILNAGNGDPLGSIQGGAGAHNTVVSLDGKYVFLGGRDSNYLTVASTATNQVVRKVGSLADGVRPFTVNGTDTLAFTTATHFLGFQVSSITTGKVLYTARIPGFSLPDGFPLSAPSHGITLTPDEKQVYVFDAPHGYVHVFDVSRVPAGAPVLVRNIKLSSIAGDEEGCAYDCARDGWLQASRDGRFVYVGDAGDVINTGTGTFVANLRPLAQTRQMLEIDWAGGLPVTTTTRYGLGYVTGALAPQAKPRGAQAAISGLAVSPRAFVAAGHGATIAARPAVTGTTVSYRDSQPAATRFTVLVPRPGLKHGRACVILPRRGTPRSQKAGGACTRYRLAGGFTHHDRAGTNRFRFSGRIGGHRLRPGQYRLRAQPAFARGTGNTALVGFRIIG